MKVKITNSENILQYWNSKLNFGVLQTRGKTLECEKIEIHESTQDKYLCNIIEIYNNDGTNRSRDEFLPSPLINEVV